MPQPEKGPWLPFDLRTPRGWVALLQGAPATLGFVVVFWALGALSSSLLSGPSSVLQPHVAASVHSLAGPWWAVLASIIAAFLYVRVIKVMYFDEPIGDGPSVAYPSVLTATTIAVGAAITLVLGVLPGPVLDLAAVAGEFIR